MLDEGEVDWIGGLTSSLPIDHRLEYGHRRG